MRPNVLDPAGPTDPSGRSDAAAASTVAPPSSRIAEEHRQLRQALARVEALEEPGALLGELRALRPRLAEHFAGEEAPDGLHRAIDASAPHRDAQVRELFAEHRECLESLDGMIAAIAELLAGPVAALRREVAEFAARLHRHEAAENELLSDVLYEELGGGD